MKNHLFMLASLIFFISSVLAAEDKALEEFETKAKIANNDLDRNAKGYGSDRFLAPIVEGLVSDNPAVRNRAVELMIPYVCKSWIAVDQFEKISWNKFDAQGKGLYLWCAASRYVWRSEKRSYPLSSEEIIKLWQLAGKEYAALPFLKETAVKTYSLRYSSWATPPIGENLALDVRKKIARQYLSVFKECETDEERQAVCWMIIDLHVDSTDKALGEWYSTETSPELRRLFLETFYSAVCPAKSRDIKQDIAEKGLSTLNKKKNILHEFLKLAMLDWHQECATTAKKAMDALDDRLLQVEDFSDNALSEETRKILKEVKQPPNIKSEEWDKILQQYKMKVARNIDIRFLGQVLDQDNIPLEGVRVRGVIHAFDNACLASFANSSQKMGEKDIGWTTVTDKDGSFIVQGVSGVSLKVEFLEKDGYLAPNTEYYKIFELSPKQFKTGIDKTSKNMPASFQMWKKRTTNDSVNIIYQEIKINKKSKDRESYNIDLRKGSLIEGKADPVDLAIEISSSVSVDAKSKLEENNWSMTLTVPEGGLVETKDRYLYKAPQNGYRPSIFIEDHIGKTSTNSYIKKFYIRSRNGAFYAGVDLIIQESPYGAIIIKIHSASNGNGSSDLKPF